MRLETKFGATAAKQGGWLRCLGRDENDVKLRQGWPQVWGGSVGGIRFCRPEAARGTLSYQEASSKVTRMVTNVFIVRCSARESASRVGASAGLSRARAL